MRIDEYEAFKSQGDARSFFRSLKRARAKMDYWRLVSEEGLAALSRSGEHVGKSGTTGDPTASAAVNLADHDAGVRADAKRKMGECELAFRAAATAISSVRDGLGGSYADALQAHYVDGRTEAYCAETYGCSRSTLMNRIAVACDWCDWQGPALFR